jgi:thioredoxin 1
MNIKAITSIAAVVLVTVGGVLYIQGQRSSDMVNLSDVPVTPTYTALTEESKNTPQTENVSRYRDFSVANFDAAKGKKRVYFFHASWCPTCKAANTEFTNNLDSIPEDVILFKTDYDTNSELKKQYAITYQHTFVLVDENGKEIKKWNGGGLSELISNTK